MIARTPPAPDRNKERSHITSAITAWQGEQEPAVSALVRTRPFQTKIRPVLKPVQLSIRVDQICSDSRVQITV
ncbi:hypothetical protein AR275_26885 [Stenotrophomonas maltophilia]|nr:hypothetical protein AR275_26885 [Stenotrophomonas maltophilia]